MRREHKEQGFDSNRRFKLWQRFFAVALIAFLVIGGTEAATQGKEAKAIFLQIAPLILQESHPSRVSSDLEQEFSSSYDAEVLHEYFPATEMTTIFDYVFGSLWDRTVFNRLQRANFVENNSGYPSMGFEITDLNILNDLTMRTALIGQDKKVCLIGLNTHTGQVEISFFDTTIIAKDPEAFWQKLEAYLGVPIDGIEILTDSSVSVYATQAFGEYQELFQQLRGETDELEILALLKAFIHQASETEVPSYQEGLTLNILLQHSDNTLEKIKGVRLLRLASLYDKEIWIALKDGKLITINGEPLVLIQSVGNN